MPTAHQSNIYTNAMSSAEQDIVIITAKTQKSSLCRLTCIKGSHCSRSENICTCVIWHKKAHEITLRYPRVVGSCTIRYDTIEEINVDSKAEYTA